MYFIKCFKQKVVLTLLSFVMLLAMGQVAFSSTITMDFGWGTASESSYGILAKKFKELAEDYTDNAIEVNLHPSGAIATEDEAFRSLQLGTIDAYIITMNNVSKHFSLIDVFCLPYIFEDRSHAIKVLDGPIGEDFADKLYEETGVYLATYGYLEPRDAYNTKRPINSISDVEGLKMRVPNNKIMIKTWKEFGAQATPLPWSEMATALQTGTVDGGDNGTSVILSQSFHDFADHLFILEHFLSFSPTFFSERFLSELNGNQKKAVLRAADEAGQYQRDVMLERIEEIREELVNKGMKMTKPPKKDFIKAGQRVQKEIAREKGEEFNSLLKQIRDAKSK